MSIADILARVQALEESMVTVKEVLDNHESELTALSETVFEPLGTKDYDS